MKNNLLHRLTDTDICENFLSYRGKSFEIITIVGEVKVEITGVIRVPTMA